MKIQQLREFAEDKNLILHKYKVSNFTRRKFIYSKTEGEIVAGVFLGKLERTEKVPYTKNYYFARTKDMPKHQNYKITAGDYKELLELGAKEDD